MPAIQSFMGNYLHWLELAGIILVFSFLQHNGDKARIVSGLCAAIGVLIFCLTKF